MEGIANAAQAAREAAGGGEKKAIGRPRRFRSAKQLETAWEEYKEWCDRRLAIAHEFSQKECDFVSAKLLRPVSYTIEGFCRYCKLARQTFYENYDKNPAFTDITTRMREEAEVDAREKFEMDMLPSRLAPLWMGRYGYTAKSETVQPGDNELLESLLRLEREALS